MNKFLFIIFILFSIILNAEELPYSTFKEAYEAEKSELESEIKMLSEYKLKNMEEHNHHSKELQNELEKLKKEVAGIKKENSTLEKRKKLLKNAISSSKSEKEMLSETIKLLFADKIKKSGKKENFSEIFIDSFNKKFESVALNDHIRKEKGSFFTKEGKKEENEITFIGNLAAYSLSGDDFNVLNSESGSLFTYLTEKKSKNESKSSLTLQPLFFWNENARYKEIKTNESFTETVKKGGIIALLILVLAFFAFLIVLERIFTLSKADKKSAKIFTSIMEKLKKGEKFEIKGKTPFENVAEVILSNKTYKRETIEEKAKEAILKELSPLQRFLPVMSIIAAVSPLMGLLGTVTGIISTFNAITAYGSGDPKIVSFGISEALITTEFGLAVAIPVLIVHALLSRWSDKISDDMEQHALSLINIIKGE